MKRNLKRLRFISFSYFPFVLQLGSYSDFFISIM